MGIEFTDPEEFKLQRYSLGFLSNIPMLVKNNRGAWVRWVDAESLLKAHLALINEKNKERLLTGWVDIIK